ncbi:ectoine synthase [Paenibacillus nasutitermitis]|uniref:L-ectoine synthase n=1 Tax=Paenibacillus nasutitermitis TaxID=1652958 RepID=A0A916Z8B6_9BACL|nr:ectoine synthase [Paenibacillus nasutitermitis]GGD81206.1 L-ectoine synthase [Paenibacillus nasutitermitis]
MIVKHLEEIVDSKYDIDTETWNARRLLLRKDGMGFSLNDTIIKAGTETTIWYKNHVEAVYCIEGEGEIEIVATGEKFAIRPGMLYALDGHEKHYLRAKTQVRTICVFNPPLTGSEVHDKDGVYPLIEEAELEANRS